MYGGVGIKFGFGYKVGDLVWWSFIGRLVEVVVGVGVFGRGVSLALVRFRVSIEFVL